MLKKKCCSRRGNTFDSQYPYGVFQILAMPIQEDLTSSDLCEHQAGTECTNIHADKTPK